MESEIRIGDYLIDSAGNIFLVVGIKITRNAAVKYFLCNEQQYFWTSSNLDYEYYDYNEAIIRDMEKAINGH